MTLPAESPGLDRHAYPIGHLHNVDAKSLEESTKDWTKSHPFDVQSSNFHVSKDLALRSWPWGQRAALECEIPMPCSAFGKNLEEGLANILPILNPGTHCSNRDVLLMIPLPSALRTGDGLQAL